MTIFFICVKSKDLWKKIHNFYFLFFSQHFTDSSVIVTSNYTFISYQKKIYSQRRFIIPMMCLCVFLTKSTPSSGITIRYDGIVKYKDVQLKNVIVTKSARLYNVVDIICRCVAVFYFLVLKAHTRKLCKPKSTIYRKYL